MKFINDYSIKTMGIKNLNKFLKDSFPNVFERVHISEYAYKKIAIDISIYLYVLKARYYNPDYPNSTRWINDFVRLIRCLRYYELHCIFIYDNYEATHPDKKAEREKRKEERETMNKKIFTIEESIQEYEESGTVNQILLDFQKSKKIKDRRILGTNNDIYVSLEDIQYHLKKMQRQLFTIDKRDFELTKELFDILDVPYLTAPLEAETLCADLCKKGIVDAVLSRDSDVMAYGSPIFITNLDINSGICKRIRYEKLLKELDLTSDQFLDFCIMCGTDFNKNIFRIGPKNAYKLILKHKTIEEVDKNTKHNVEILNHIRVRELFRNYETVNVDIQYCGQPDRERLESFLKQHYINTNIDELLTDFEHSHIVFED